MSNNNSPEDSGIDVKEDPDLSSMEKETVIRFANDEDKATVFSESNGIMRRLLQHPHADVTTERTVEGKTVAVRGEIPIDMLKITSTPRSSGSRSDIVSNNVSDSQKESE